jgi:hypothetical protein
MTRAQRNKARRKKDRSLETGRFARKMRKEIDRTLLTATGKFCYELGIAYRPQILLGTASEHKQFFGKTRENF